VHPALFFIGDYKKFSRGEETKLYCSVESFTNILTFEIGERKIWLWRPRAILIQNWIWGEKKTSKRELKRTTNNYVGLKKNISRGGLKKLKRKGTTNFLERPRALLIYHEYWTIPHLFFSPPFFIRLTRSKLQLINTQQSKNAQ